MEFHYKLILIPKYIMKVIIKIVKEYLILKLGFVVLTTYLLYQELYGFFITKPTYSSSSKLIIGETMETMEGLYQFT